MEKIQRIHGILADVQKTHASEPQCASFGKMDGLLDVEANSFVTTARSAHDQEDDMGRKDQVQSSVDSLVCKKTVSRTST